MLGLVELRNTSGRAKGVQIFHDRVGAGFEFLIAITADQLTQFGDVGRARVLQRGTAAFFPVLDQVGAHLTGPAHTAFHEAEIEARVAAYDAAEENASRERVVGFGEVADVVVGEVAD